MIVDLRYQIITTVIIFLSLAMGILIGSSMVGQEGIVDKQKDLINRLEGDFLELRAQNRDFQAEVELLEERLENNMDFQQQLFSLALEDQLKGERALIVYSEEGLKDLAWELSAILEVAGSQEVSIKPSEDLAEGLDWDMEQYLIYLGKEEVARLEDDFKDQFENIIYFSGEIFSAKRELIEGILDLNKSQRREKRSVIFE